MTPLDSKPSPDSAPTSPWAAATPLRRRLQRLRELPAEIWRQRSDRQLGERRIELWRRQPPFDRDDVFERRRVADGLQEDSFRDLLGLPAEALAELLPEPDWAGSIAAAFEHPSAPPPGCSWPALLDGHRSTEARPLLGWLEPLVNPALRSLHRLSLELAEAGGPVPWDPESVVPLLAQALPDRMVPKVQRTLILELNVARLEERLEGETPAERFQSFVQHLQEPAHGLALLAEYPSLARILSLLVEQWREASEELLTRLAADWPALRERWATASENAETATGGVGKSERGNPIGAGEHRLESVETDAGDPHRGGRSVALLGFRSGLRLVYKPRSTAVDQRFAELLEWLHRRGLEPVLEAVDTLDRGSHGWSAFVTPGPCRTADEARRFFQRQGSFLALLHALEATDFHYQNLIADGEHPRLVDLEALFHPRQRQVEAGTPLALMADSVLRVGLLPQRLWQRRDAGEGAEVEGSGGGPEASGLDVGGLDVSGLASQAGQHDPHAAPMAEGLGTDQARVVRRRNVITAGHHRARLGDEELSPVAYREDLLDGFSRTYRLLLGHRDELLAEDGPLASFAEVELRAILRPTRVYALIQGESYHPGALGEASIRDRLFDRLWLEAADRPELDSVIPAEQEALHRGDIPFFSTHPASRDLLGEGRIFEGHFQTSGLDAARRKIAALSEADLERQRWFIEMSLSTVTEGVEEIARASPDALGDVPGLLDGPPAKQELMATVEQLAERIRRLALRFHDGTGSHDEDGEGVTWLGVRTGPDESLFLAELSADLQHGLAGIALFLAQLASLRDDAELHDLARRAWKTTREHIGESVGRVDGAQESLPDPIPRIGGFVGWGSLIYTAVRLADLWPEQKGQLLDFAESLVPQILRRLPRDRDRDLLGGAAGAVVALLRLHERRRHRREPTRALDAAIACAEKLLADAQPQPKHQSGGGVGWPGVAGDQPITGFSHGTAGIAWALLQLAQTLRGEPHGHEVLIPRLEETAARALEFERRAFRAEEDATGSGAGQWLDLRFYDLDGNVRPGQDPPPLFPAWCHGGAGIGLSRLAFLEAARSEHSCFSSPEERERLLEEIQAAARAISATGFGHNQGLCHGDLGNLEILRRLARTLEDEELLQRHDRLAAAILHRGKTRGQGHGWRCGTALGVETPSLMNGLAGIGYGLLRLAYPDRVPSVLTLEI